MNERKLAFLGLLGPVVAYLFTGISIVLSPWFEWQSNDLSDLGHSVRSNVAQFFNFGLVLAGLFVAIYAITAFKEEAKYTSCFTLIGAFLLQLVATFDEVYGFLHTLVSVLLFVFFSLTLIVFAVETKSAIPLVAFFISIGVWVGYFFDLYRGGIAIPEIIASLAISSCVVHSAARIILGFSTQVSRIPNQKEIDKT